MLFRSLVYGGIANGLQLNLKYVNSEEVTLDSIKTLLSGLDGILVPGGFGTRGVEGKILTAQFARENKVPFFGICLGLQCSVIEFARNVAGLEKANSEEFNPLSPDKVIYLMKEWFDPNKNTKEVRNELSNKGGTMRLGSYPCALKEDTFAFKAYGRKLIHERHRHRYEFNNAYLEPLQNAGMTISGMSPEGDLVEIVELADHPWYLACQFHPEFKSTPMSPHPLFRDFIEAANKAKK